MVVLATEKADHVCQGLILILSHAICIYHKTHLVTDIHVAQAGFEPWAQTVLWLQLLVGR